MHPAEDTLPELLSQVGYGTALFGHADIGQNSTSGTAAAVFDVGFGAFRGLGQSHLPPDPTVGSQASDAAFECGLPLEGLGACCFEDGDCLDGLHPLDCTVGGGVPLLREVAPGEWVVEDTCGPECGQIDFGRSNGHYRWPETKLEAGDQNDSEVLIERYSASHIVDEAADWVHDQSHSPPWFCMVSMPAPGGPHQPAPPSLVQTVGPLGCDPASDPEGVRLAARQRLEAMDAELGRMLVDMDLANWDGDQFEFEPFHQTRTWIILTSDGGSSAALAMPPFDADQAGSTLYQTSLHVPLLIAGPHIDAPGRDSEALVNLTDVFMLIADAAEVVPDQWSSRTRDGQSPMSFLLDSEGEAPRQFSHADMGVVNFPLDLGGLCVVGDQCDDFRYATAAACESDGGVFMPRGTPFEHCCEYWAATGEPAAFRPQTMRAWAVRNATHKLIVRVGASCPREASCELELHRLATPLPPDIGGVESDETLIELPATDPIDVAALAVLKAELAALIESEPYCEGDCNRDYRVDANDLIGVLADWGKSQLGQDPRASQGSFFDATQDGMVGTDDILAVIHGWSEDCSGETPFPMSQEEQDMLGPAWNHPWFSPDAMTCVLDGP